MKQIVLYCDDCRVMTNLDRSPHVRVNAKCQFCGREGMAVFVWSYSRSRINKAIRDIRERLKKEGFQYEPIEDLDEEREPGDIQPKD